VKTSTSSPASVSWISRRPGVSITRAPPGSENIWRWVVVCRPRSSETRTAAVRWASRSSKRLTSVDLPAPDEPTSASVRPARSSAIRGAGSSPDSRQADTTVTPVASDESTGGSAPAAAARSALLSRTSGVASPVIAAAVLPAAGHLRSGQRPNAARAAAIVQ